MVNFHKFCTTWYEILFAFRRHWFTKSATGLPRAPLVHQGRKFLNFPRKFKGWQNADIISDRWHLLAHFVFMWLFLAHQTLYYDSGIEFWRFSFSGFLKYVCCILIVGYRDGGVTLNKWYLGIAAFKFSYLLFTLHN